jgi:O-antigen/teichoic acid export membrane protein
MLNQTLIIAQLPIGSVFTELEKKGQRDEMVRLFSSSSFSFSVIISFLIGILFFAIKFFVLIVYPLNYIAAIDQVRLFILAVYFIFITSNYHGLFSITNNQKRVTLVESISAGLSILVSTILSIYFNFLGIVIGNVIGNAIYAVIYWAYGKYRLKEFKIPFLQIFQHAIALIVFLAIIVWMSPFIANYDPITNFSNQILQFVSSIVNFDVNTRYPGILEGVINLVLFIILFYLYILLSRSITKEDINAIEQSGIKIPFAKYLKKLVLSRKNIPQVVDSADQKT